MESPSGVPMQSRYLAVANKAREPVRGLLAGLGTLPAGRNRVAGYKDDITTLQG